MLETLVMKFFIPLSAIMPEPKNPNVNPMVFFLHYLRLLNSDFKQLNILFRRLNFVQAKPVTNKFCHIPI